MIHVIATIELAPGTRDAYLAEFRKLVPLVHNEVGVAEYGPAVDEPSGLAAQELAGEDVVIVIEKWTSVAALKAHVNAPHMAEFRTRVKDLVKHVSLHVLRPVASADTSGM